MEIIKTYKEEVIFPESLTCELDNSGEWAPWCSDHKEFFDKCNCPKQNSTPETDGWQIYEKGKKIYASPTREIYDARALWIEVHKKSMECTRCGGKINMDDYKDSEKHLDEIPYTELIGHLIDTFYEKHILCKESEAAEKPPIADEVKS